MKWLTVAVLAGAIPSLLAAQRPAPAAGPPDSATPGTRLQIYVMTMGPGAEIWERFGHNAIGVRDLDRGTDLVYNYGTFSFQDPGFLARFALGRLTYWLAVADAGRTVEFYRDDRHRSVWIQELALAPAERVAMRDFLEWNARDENKYYRYDYYRDNCSTRVRDALDRIIGGRLKAVTDTIATGTTYRSHTRRLTANNPATYTALLAALGHPVDRPISAWEEMFLPMALREHLRRVRVSGPEGGQVPLVAAERTLYESDRFEARPEPPHWGPWYLLAAVLVGGLALVLGGYAGEHRAARTGFAMLATLWYLVLGVGGVILVFFWGFSEHQATHPNENVLLFNLLALPLAFMVPLALRRGGGLLRGTFRLALVVAGVSFLGLLLKAIPAFDQVNLQLIAFMLPINIAVAAGLLILSRKSVSGEREEVRGER